MQKIISDIVFDNTNFGLLVVDKMGFIVDVNQWFMNHCRCEKTQLVDQSLFECFTFNNELTIKRSLEHATQYGMSSFLSSALHPRLFPLFTRSNKYSQFMDQSCYVKSITFNDKRYALFQVQDVTDSTKRESLLKVQTKELSIFSLAVKHSPSAVVITDALGIIEYVNPKYTEITDYQSNECIGRPYFSLGRHTDNEKSEKNIWRMLEQEKEWTGERCNLTKNGNKYWANEHIYPIVDSDKNVSHYVAMQDDVTQFRNIARKFSYQAAHDSLTGLINRQEFESILRKTIDGRSGSKESHALCFVDIDQFKIVNDTCGHVAGDELLRQISVLFKQHCYNDETVARLGGDEFALLLFRHDISQAKLVCEMLIKLVDDFRFRWNDNVFKLGISIGITEINEQSNSYIETIKQADSACYGAKDAGRNRYHIYQENDQALAQRKDDTYWATKINSALEQDCLTLYAQPIVSLQKHSKISYEILVRMLDELGNLIPPGLFLPAAERFNLSHRIDQWVVDNTLAWLCEHHDDIEHIDHISINLSGLSLSNEMLLQHIIKAVKSNKVEASKITFEITETAAIANLTHAQLFISALNACGCKFALDDFGSGLSSFAYLKNLKVDILKIDGMFVKDMINDPIDEAMVKSINDVGHVMGMETIAEFVENDEIRDRLVEMGIDYGQGYGLGKPVPIDEIIKVSVVAT
jgi:diguanylate cyclase (GGDEF)-like protein/PAS domain S-box-containing protein